MVGTGTYHRMDAQLIEQAARIEELENELHALDNVATQLEEANSRIGDLEDELAKLKEQLEVEDWRYP